MLDNQNQNEIENEEKNKQSENLESGEVNDHGCSCNGGGNENLKELPNASEIKQKQIRNLIIIILGGAIVFGFLYFLIVGGSSPKKPITSKAQTEKIEFVSPSNNDDAKSIWIERIQNQVQGAVKSNQNLNQKLDDINKVQQEIIEQGKIQQNEFQAWR